MENKEKPELTHDELEQLKLVIQSELSNTPPTIGLIGVSGVGKSSTLNALFKTSLPISHTKACTKEFRAEKLSVEYKDIQIGQNSTDLIVIDAPGLGENIRLDDNYLEMYKEKLGQCDVILWVIAARNRAIALDQLYLKNLSEFHSKIIFGINQVDLIEPIDWNSKINLPSVEQEKYMQEIEEDRKSKLEEIIGRKISIVSYSSSKKYRLQELFTALILACPENRAWIFEGLKNFKYDDFVPSNFKNPNSEDFKAKEDVALTFCQKIESLINRIKSYFKI